MKAIKVITAAAVIALPLQFAQAAGGDSVSAQLVMPDVTGFSGGMGIALGYEMPMPQVNPNFSVEGEFTTTISDPDDSAAGFTWDISYYTLAAYAKYTHPVNQQLDLYGRIGLLYESLTISTNFAGSASDSDFGLSFGFGANYEINPQMDFTAGFTVIEQDINHLSAGIRYKL